MNLHGIVSGYVSAINPQELVTLQASTGYSTGPDGTQTPTYAAPLQAYAQVQPLDAGDLRQIEGLNLQGQKRKFYLNGVWNGVVRPKLKGGDLITRFDSTVWLVVQVPEYWPDWTAVIATLQNGS